MKLIPRSKIFYENDALTEFVRLFNSESCPDHQHTLETILTLSSAKPNAMSSLVESDPLLVEAFLEKLTERRQIIQDSEDHLDEINIINQIRTLLTPTSTEDKLVPEMKTTQHIVPIS
ncbi:unnamed protein product [Rotaria socialis]|uniref:Uncharacterized protein n=1 Tax=Rotaria socialis TaxID=392032 RepID=A0A818FXI3_9BILA|nr:unnamed protein product [Rotaria socialis]CAF4859314.1 unnamed protein product [Rotaria socialis]